MTKSRTLPAVFLLVLAGPLPAVAQTAAPEPPPVAPAPLTVVTADEAIALDRARMHDAVNTECPPGQLDDDVVVCGRRPGFQRYRVPMIGADVSEGTRERAGDAQLYAMEAGGTRCSTVGRDQTCGGGLDVIAIGFAIARGIAQALLNRD